MLSHFVIEYIQDETDLKLGYFWRYKSNLRAAYIWYTYVSYEKSWPVTLRLFEVKSQDGVLS